MSNRRMHLELDVPRMQERSRHSAVRRSGRSISRRSAREAEQENEPSNVIVQPGFFSQHEDTRKKDYMYYFTPSDTLRKSLQSPRGGRVKHKKSTKRSKDHKSTSSRRDLWSKGGRPAEDKQMNIVEVATKITEKTEEGPSLTTWQRLTGNVPVSELSIYLLMPKEDLNLESHARLKEYMAKENSKRSDTAQVTNKNLSRTWPPHVPSNPPGDPDEQLHTSRTRYPVKPIGRPSNFRRKLRASNATTSKLKSNRRNKNKSKENRRYSLVGPVVISQVKNSKIPYVILPPPQPRPPMKETSKGKVFKPIANAKQQRVARETMGMLCEDKLSELMRLKEQEKAIERSCAQIEHALHTAVQEMEDQKTKEEAFTEKENSTPSGMKYLTSLITGRVWEVQQS